MSTNAMDLRLLDAVIETVCEKLATSADDAYLRESHDALSRMRESLARDRGRMLNEMQRARVERVKDKLEAGTTGPAASVVLLVDSMPKPLRPPPFRWAAAA